MSTPETLIHEDQGCSSIIAPRSPHKAVLSITQQLPQPCPFQEHNSSSGASLLSSHRSKPLWLHFGLSHCHCFSLNHSRRNKKAVCSSQVQELCRSSYLKYCAQASAQGADKGCGSLCFPETAQGWQRQSIVLMPKTPTCPSHLHP